MKINENVDEEFDIDEEIKDLSGPEYKFIRNYVGIRGRELCRLYSFRSKDGVYKMELKKAIKPKQALPLFHMIDIKLWRAARRKWASFDDKEELFRGVGVKAKRQPLPPGRFRVVKRKKRK